MLQDRTDRRFFTNRETMFRELASDIKSVLKEAINLRGAASMVLSGGSTPLPLYRHLSQMALPWEKVTATLSDERWVDRDDPQSNEKALHQSLLTQRAAAASLVGLKNTAPTPKQGETACNQALAKLARPFDLVLLGMGEDGHTASLFPGQPELVRALDLDNPDVCTGMQGPNLVPPRMTLNLATLLHSRKIALLVAGPGKKETLEKASQPGPTLEMPIRAILRQNSTPVSIYWAP